jgi:predicted site-specific integrase-resolvase
MTQQHNEQAPYPEALTRIEQALARIQIASDLAAQKIEVAAKAAAVDAIEAAKQIAVLIERVSTHCERKDLHGSADAITNQRKWLVGVLLSAVAALVAVIWKTVSDHMSQGVSP